MQGKPTVNDKSKTDIQGCTNVIVVNNLIQDLCNVATLIRLASHLITTYVQNLSRSIGHFYFPLDS